MDFVSDVKNNKAYVKYKTLVKKWEKDFKLKHSRVPSKFDIREAPSKVRYAYKQYFQMKSAALEESLIDCPLDESEAGSPEFSPLPDSGVYDGSPNAEFSLDNLPSTSQIEQLLSTVKKPLQVNNSKCEVRKSETTSNEVSRSNGWFSKVENNNTSQPQQKHDLSVKNICDKVSKKLFKNSKFCLRNPRKSSFSKLSQNTSDENSCTRESDETMTDIQSDQHKLLTQCDSDDFFQLKFKESTTNNCNSHIDMENASFDKNLTLNSQRQINLGWLERATGSKIEASEKTHVQKDVNKTYGLSNIDATVVEKINSDYVENSESEMDEVVSCMPLKPALKKRKLDNSNTDKSTKEDEFKFFKSKTNDSEVVQNDKCVESMKRKSAKIKSNRKKTKPIKKKTLSKESKLKQVLEENDSSKPPDIEDFVTVGVEKNIIPRFDKCSQVFKTIETKTNNSNSTKNASSQEIKLEKKIKDGTLNENFVKINIKKKVFVRGRKSFNYSKFKKQQFKDKRALSYEVDFPEGGKMSCFKCGSHSHMSRYCTAHRGDSLLPLEACPTDVMPTLTDMENRSNSEPEKENKLEMLTQYATSAVPDSFIELLSQSSQKSSNQDQVLPIYDCKNYNSEETPKEVQDCLNMFGHETFRPGQREAVMRVLSGLSTLLILSTGSGKSLCYQLPAYLYSKYYKCVTLVISPLVSLMDDQVLGMPEFLKAGCLHTNQPLTQRQKIMQLLKDGELNVLLISPEALITGDRSSGIGSLFKSLPPIAFACIDEAHCVSQWSHNFRPSYLMICKVLREKLKVNCILGLTATASQSTISSIIDHINVPDGLSGVITNPALPSNLILSVSHEKDKDRSLVTLLTSEPFSSYNSIIVYCIRRDECERVASMLRSTLQEPGKVVMERGRKRKRMSYLAETYHAGLSAAQRRKIQDNFMNGSLRIIVATVAFGMGINKSDIRCIIHYNMPKSFESYVQEVGRAGRDGDPAHCHVFMNRNNDDKNELLKHVYSDSIDRHVIRKLLQKVFVPCECKNMNKNNEQPQTRCRGHEVAFSIDETVEELDTASENISTILCYLELHPKKYIQVLNNCYTVCKIHSYGGPQKLLEAAKNCPPLAMAYTLGAKKDSNITTTSVLEFPVVDVAAAIGWESGLVKYNLKNLEWIQENGKSKRSALKVEFNSLGLHVRAPGDFEPSEMDEILDNLHSRVQTQERTMLYQLEEISNAFKKVAKNTVAELYASDRFTCEEQSNELKGIINNYFERENLSVVDIEIEARPINEEKAASDIRALISAYKDCSFSGRSIARILQGIPSPNFPALVWGRCRFWRTHMHEDFHGLARLATQILIDMRF